MERGPTYNRRSKDGGWLFVLLWMVTMVGGVFARMAGLAVEVVQGPWLAMRATDQPPQIQSSYGHKREREREREGGLSLLHGMFRLWFSVHSVLSRMLNSADNFYSSSRKLFIFKLFFFFFCAFSNPHKCLVLKLVEARSSLSFGYNTRL
jgi:hypothetical protein